MNETPALPRAEAALQAETALRQVIADGPKIHLDHYIVYHARGWLRGDASSTDNS